MQPMSIMLFYKSLLLRLVGILSVAVKVSSISISAAIINSTVRLDCSSVNNVYPQWKDDTLIYNVNGKPEFVNSNLGEKLLRLSWGTNMKDLMISNIQWKDQGKYRCGATVAIDLEVRVPPQPPVITSTVTIDANKKVLGTEDQNLTLKCTSTGGSPAPTVSWYRVGTGNSPLKEASAGVLQPDNTTTVILDYVFTPGRSDDRVNYICKSEFSTDPKSPSEISVQMFLNLKPKKPNVTQTTIPTENQNQNTEVARCDTSGFRPSTTISVSWIYNSTTNLYSGNPTYNGADETYTITAYYQGTWTRQDNGKTLTCSVNHATLSTALMKSVNVIVYFASSSVTMTGNIKGFVANGIRQLTLTCTTSTSNPVSTITWNQGQPGTIYPVTDGDYAGKIRNQTQVITPTREMDGNTISCSANNTVNMPVTAQAVLNLTFKPIVSLAGLSSVTEGDNAVLNCSAESKPLSTFTWYHNNNVIYPTGTPDADNVFTYTITRVNRTHYGTYKCKASNNVEEDDEKTTSLSVRFGPDSMSLSGSTTVVVDGTNKISVNCTTGTAYPASDITWKVGNQPRDSSKHIGYSAGDYGGQISSQILEFVPTREMDGQNITCAAYNEVNSQNPVSDVVILDLRYGPIVTILSSPIVNKEGTLSQVVLPCSVSSKPVSTVKWYKDGQSSPIETRQGNRFDHTIRNLNRSHAGMYRCTANNNIGGDVSAEVQVIVQYAPDVTVTTTNVTVNFSEAVIDCSPSGVPDAYTYQPWTHSWFSDGTEIVNEPALNSTKTLRLTELTYQHSGLYTCMASNGVSESNKPNAGIGKALLFVKSFPIITDPVVDVKHYHKVSTNLGEPTNVSITYYNNGDTQDVKCYKLNATTRQESNMCSSSTSVTIDIQLTVFRQTVTTPGTMTTVTMTVLQEDIGYYAIVVTNEIGEGVLPVQIVPEGPPNVPEQVNITTVHQTDVIISWIRGFHGGFDQTFVIQLSKDSNTWWNKSSVFGGQETSRDPINATVDELLPGTVYYLRMFSYNQEETWSPYTDVINFTTAVKDEEGTSPSSPGALIGGAAAGGLFILVIVVVVAIVLIRRNQYAGKKHTDDQELNGRNVNEDDDSDSDVQTENPTYDSAGLRPSEIGVGTSNDNTYAMVNKPNRVQLPLDNTDTYAQVEKPKKKEDLTDVYATPVKKKGDQVPEKANKEKAKKAHKGDKKDKKGKKTGKYAAGDVYENAPTAAISASTTYSNGQGGAYEENPYENPEDCKIPQQPKRNVNKDGLLYADLSFKTDSNEPGKLVIHGLDDMTEYSNVDFTKKAEPLPESDEEDQNANKK